MRQNTKVVVAKRDFSNESASAEGDRPVSADNVLSQSAKAGAFKPGHDRSKSWTTEPWNGKARRKSLRSVDKKGPVGAAAGVSTGLDIVPEDQLTQDKTDALATPNEETDDGVERGRLFVKVVGVKELDLPLPQSKFYGFCVCFTD
jgi:hypothetical protein